MARGSRRAGRRARGLAGFWVGAGVMHFVIPREYEAMVPDWVPAHREVVAWTGVAEIAGGLAVLSPRTRAGARWWLLATLLAVYPANVNMALHPERYRRVPAWALYARLPVQGLFAWVTWRGTAER